MKRYLLAEYCEGPFYMGWWLYLRDRNDGSPNDGNEWGWLRCHCRHGEPCRCAVSKVADLCATLRTDVPEPRRHSDRLAEWFAANFPAGLLIETQHGEPWRLIEVVAELPKQVHRRIIRTKARADRSFARACRKEKA